MLQTLEMTELLLMAFLSSYQMPSLQRLKMTHMEPFCFVLGYRVSHRGFFSFSFFSFFLEVTFENETTVWPFIARKSLLLLPKELEEDKTKCGIIHQVWYAEIGLIGTILGESRVL